MLLIGNHSVIPSTIPKNIALKISIRFFPDEASNLLSILISNLNEIDLEDDYYNVLLENREAYKKK